MSKWWQTFYQPFKTPRFIQMENAECGAAALGMILGYYGKFVPLPELRKTCGTSRSGVSIEDINLAAHYYGLDIEVYETPFEELKETKLPAILYWDFNHFVVLEDFTDGKVKINDPAMGHRTLSFAELEKSYSGLLMEFTPGKSFQKSGEKESFFQKVGKKIDPFKKSLRFLFCVQLSLALLGLALPVFAQAFIDQFFGTLLPTWEWGFLFLFLGIVFFTTLMNWVQNIFLNLLQVRIAIQFSTEFLWKILRLPILFFKQRFSSELIYRQRLNTRIGEILTINVILNTLNIFLLSSYWIIMLFYSIPITLVAAAIAIYNLILVWYIGKTRRNSYAQLQQAEARAIGISFDSLEHIETMKANSNEQFFFSSIASAYTETVNYAQEIGKKDIWLSALSRFSQQLSTVLILGLGSYEILQGNLTIGKLIALQILYHGFLAPISQLVSFSTEVQSVDVDLNRLDDVLEEKEDPFLQARETSASEEPLKGEVVFSQVHFGYKMLQPSFIENLNLHFQKGELVALTGPIASGKTTIAKLIACLLQPNSGDVLYDGKHFQEIAQKTFCDSIGIVDQIIELFPGTIQDNLTLWNTIEISNEEMIRAAQMACIHEDIAKLPEGYGTIVEEEGKNFSAGQRQRLEITRALLKKPSFLILDEATNSIDAETEMMILSNIRSLGISTLLISHRLSTFKYCDRILVLAGGKVIQEGTHETLSKTDGLYQQLLLYEIHKKI